MSLEHIIGIIAIVLAYSAFCVLVFYSCRVVEKIYKSNASTPRQIKRILKAHREDE